VRMWTDFIRFRAVPSGEPSEHRKKPKGSLKGGYLLTS